MAEASDSMEYQTCVLKVPIHCEGCKKKVKKVLFKIPGVHDAQIDSKQNKVTVVGTVDAGTIVNKLLKANKHAELWPDEKPANPNPEPSTEIKKTKPAVAKSDQKPKTETTPAPAPAPAPEDSAAKPADAPMEPSAKPVAEAETEKPKESAKSEPNSEKVSDGQPPEAAAKPSSSKKKGKKPQKTPVAGAGEVGEEVSAPPEKVAENSARAVPRPVQQPQPVHAYNMAHPTTSQSYYAPAPPAPMQHGPQPYGFSYYQPPQAYAYPSSSHPEPAESHYSPPDAYYSPYSAYPPPESSYRYDEPPQPSSESYDMFSDENANACKVM